VMSSASFAVTYTSVYTNSEPGRVFWGADEEISEGGSPRVIVLGYDGLPIQPPHDPDYVPEPIYPEYIPLEDEHVFLVEEQPLPPVDSPTAESPGYVAELDLEEYEDDETEDGPIDYPIDGGANGDDDDGDSSEDDADDEDEDEEDKEEEEEDSVEVMEMVVVRDDGGAWRGGWCRGGDGSGVVLVDLWWWCSVDVVTWGWRWRGDSGVGWHGSGG
ncbi:hypothetical protein Tco_0904666, partial [Tanacetum coccineum]